MACSQPARIVVEWPLFRWEIGSALCIWVCDVSDSPATHITEQGNSSTATARAAIRPVLVASKSVLAEQSTFLRHLLVGLLDEPISTALVCPPGCQVESVAPAPVTVVTHPAIGLPLLDHFGIDLLAGQLAKLKPTVLHGLCESRARLVRRLAQRLDLPYVQTINSLVRRFRRLPISPQRCKAIVVPAQTIGTQLARLHPPLASRVRQINMGTFVEGDAICFSDPARLASVVLAGRIQRVSDFERFFKAIKALLAEGRQFMVVLMGSGPAEHRLRELLVQLGLSQAVTIVPILDPWRSVLAAGDIFVQPQPMRSFSVFLLEAMSLGAAVAASMDGVDDLLIPNQTAVIFESNDEQSIHRALAHLLDDHDFARRLARTAQEHLRAGYSVSQMVSATLKVYAEAQGQYGG
jgi:glycosyltransferase involved in cell wall biosynthesis